MAKQTDRILQARDAINAAGANGWQIIPANTPNTITVRRMTEHVTPQWAQDNGWYPNTVYSTCEFLSFVFFSRTRVPKVTYGTAPCPWVGRTDTSLSFKRSLELLAQPLAESSIHDRD